MSAHGLPFSILDADLLGSACISDALLIDLAGNSFVSHCFLRILHSVLTYFPGSKPRRKRPQPEADTAPKPEEETATSVADIADILGL